MSRCEKCDEYIPYGELCCDCQEKKDIDDRFDNLDYEIERLQQRVAELEEINKRRRPYT